MTRAEAGTCARERREVMEGPTSCSSGSNLQPVSARRWKRGNREEGRQTQRWHHHILGFFLHTRCRLNWWLSCGRSGRQEPSVKTKNDVYTVVTYTSSTRRGEKKIRVALVVKACSKTDPTEDCQQGRSVFAPPTPLKPPCTPLYLWPPQKKRIYSCKNRLLGRFYSAGPEAQIKPWLPSSLNFLLTDSLTSTWSLDYCKPS